MQPPPEGVWGMPPEMLRTLPGYDPDVAKNRAEARGSMEKLGYGPDNRLAIKVSARNIAPTRDPAVLLTGQLKEIYIDAELEMVDTTNWFPKVLRKDFTVGMVVSENGLDDPDPRISTRITRAAPSATTRTTATRTSRRSSTSNRRRPTGRSAAPSSGRSTRSFKRTWRAPSSSTPVKPHAGSPRSKASP